MHWTQPNVGREDRLVRACLALSLFLLGGFAIAASGHVGVFTLLLATGLAYFALTAALAWDPLYAYLEMDTGPDPTSDWGAPMEQDVAGDGAWHIVVDLTDSLAESGPAPSDSAAPGDQALGI